MKKYYLLFISLLSFITFTTVTNHATASASINLNDNVKPNTSPAATHPVPWETNSQGQAEIAKLVHHNEILYYISPGDRYTNLLVNAANGWNYLNVIKFVRTYDQSKSDIYFTEDQVTPTNTRPNFVTMAQTLMTPINNSNVIKSQIDIQTKAFNSRNQQQQLATIQHELGHALGFDHDDYLGYDHDMASPIGLIMQSDYSVYGYETPELGQIEQKALLQHYPLSIHKLSKKDQIEYGNLESNDLPADQ